MTREEAKSELMQIYGMLSEEKKKALDMAIKALEYDDAKYHEEHGEVVVDKAVWEDAKKALEQEPYKDAISRDFQIGDEVRIIGSNTIYDDCDVGWVIRNASERVKTMYVMRNDGSAEEENKEEWYKTGRHNTTLAEVIKALPSVNPQKWIPVSERLPEESGEYLIAIKDRTYLEISWFYPSNKEWSYRNLEIVAWMPLPKPYEPQERSEDAT